MSFWSKAGTAAPGPQSAPAPWECVVENMCTELAARKGQKCAGVSAQDILLWGKPFSPATLRARPPSHYTPNSNKYSSVSALKRVLWLL